MLKLFSLLVIYQIKHFLADYPLQGKYMLGKFKPYPSFIMPLLSHSVVHALFTFAIASIFRPTSVAALLGLFDLSVHFIVDRIKASPNMLGKFKPITKEDYERHLKDIAFFENEIKECSVSQDTIEHAADLDAELNLRKVDFEMELQSNKYFWWSLGWDQMMHHLTHYVIIWFLL